MADGRGVAVAGKYHSVVRKCVEAAANAGCQSGKVPVWKICPPDSFKEENVAPKHERRPRVVGAEDDMSARMAGDGDDGDGSFFSLDSYGQSLQPAMTKELEAKISRNVGEAFNNYKD